MRRTLIKASSTVGMLSMLAFSATPAFAAVDVTGNGAFSETVLDHQLVNEQTVVQESNADINQDFDLDLSTGNNSLDYNTGGDAVVRTGSIQVEADVQTSVNQNRAGLPSMSSMHHPEVTVEGNGAESETYFDFYSNNSNSIFQDSQAYIDTEFDVSAETGDNSADYTTGGDVLLQTGGVMSMFDVMNRANENWAMIGGSQQMMNQHHSNGGMIDVMGNGAFSETDINLYNDSSVSVVQDTYASIATDVETDFETGGNDADYNTNGDVRVGTGQAGLMFNAMNAGNMNMAGLGSMHNMHSPELMFDGNGAASFNAFSADAMNSINLFQGGEESSFEVDTNVNGEVSTGENDADYNTAGNNGDQNLVVTGATVADLNVQNQGGMNLFGGMDNIEFAFDMGGMWNMFN